MHGYMFGLGNETAFGVKQGTAFIQAFFDIGGKGGPSEVCPHLLGDGQYEVLEDFKGHWVKDGHFCRYSDTK